MATDSTIACLNRLVALHNRTLARYLAFASPTWSRGDELAQRTLVAIANDQQAVVDRLGELVVEAGGYVELGSYPIAFEGYHDLSFAFLLTKLTEEQGRLVKLISYYTEKLALHPMARAVAEEALGLAKGHLENLQDLQHPASTSH